MRVVRLKTDIGQFPVVMGEPGRKFTQYVRIGYPVRVRKITNEEAARYSTEINYPLRRACRRMIRFGAHGNISKQARQFLKEGLK